MSDNSVSNTRRSLAAACLLAALIAPAWAGPVGVRLPFESARVGHGTLHYFGFRLYDITLWAPNGKWRPDAPYALELAYAREFAGATLASSTLEQMRKQGRLSPPTLATWGKKLGEMLPDVKPGDRLAAVRIPGHGVSFHAGTRPLGQIGDEAFAESFFAIWLDARTAVPALRSRLLGG